MRIRAFVLAGAFASTLTAAASAQMTGPSASPDAAPASGAVIPGAVPGDSGAGVRRGMEQQNNSGEVGDVSLYPQGQNTRVVVTISGEPPGRTQPAHMHRGQTCDNIDPKPAYPLHNVVNGKSSTIVNIPVDRLLSGNYAVNVHSSPTNMTRYVSCGHLDPQSVSPQ